LNQEILGSEAKQKCKTAWDKLAAEYYSTNHMTSRNFDMIIRHNFSSVIPKLSSTEPILDIGGGKGRLKELYPNFDGSIIVGDFSLPMLKINNYFSKNTTLVQTDAFNIPFKSGVFQAVFSLLGDSYPLEKVFSDVYRVLRPEGFFFIALPNRIWRKNIALVLGIDENETVFLLRDGKKLRVPSFLYAADDLGKILFTVGFEILKSGDWDSSNLTEHPYFSEHVLIAARNMNITPEKVPLITYALARKSKSPAR
jgi:ubiquinone/menaquinone biosynthesis C-methylase UbiE